MRWCEQISEKYPNMSVAINTLPNLLFGQMRWIKIHRDSEHLGNIWGYGLLTGSFETEGIRACDFLAKGAPFGFDLALREDSFLWVLGGTTTFLPSCILHTICVGKDVRREEDFPVVVFVAESGGFPQEFEHVFSLSRLELRKGKVLSFSETPEIFRTPEGFQVCMKVSYEPLFNMSVSDFHKTFDCSAAEFLWEIVRAFLPEKPHRPASEFILRRYSAFYFFAENS